MAPRGPPEGRLLKAMKSSLRLRSLSNPQLRLSGVREMRKREINESGEKATGAGIIFGDPIADFSHG